MWFPMLLNGSIYVINIRVSFWYAGLYHPRKVGGGRGGAVTIYKKNLLLCIIYSLVTLLDKRVSLKRGTRTNRVEPDLYDLQQNSDKK